MQNGNKLKKKVTLKDIADIAGVSKTTVSLVLNKGVGHERISETTRRKIEKIADELKYEVDYIGAALKRQSTMQIALAVPNIYHPFMPEMIRGVEETLREKGYNILLLNFTNQKSENIISTLNKLISGGVDGLISFSMGKEIEGKLFWDIPIVHIDENDYTPAVRFDAEGAARKLTQYFIDKGMKKIAFIGADIDKSTYLAREIGYRQAMEEAGLQEWTKLVTNVEVSYKGGQDAYRWLAELGEDMPEAIVVNTDNVAHVLMFSIMRAGMKIPDDIAIASIDNIELSKIIIPTLTCINVPAYKMGVKASEMMLDILDGKNLDDKVHMVPIELIVRESSEKKI